MKIRPLHDRVSRRSSPRVRKRPRPPAASSLPLDSAAGVRSRNQGEVLAVGPGKTLDNGEVRALAT
jgi:chaperonin GroES